MNTTTFWVAAVERAIRTVAQSAIATIGVTASVTQVDWPQVAGVAALAGLLSLLTSIAASGVGQPGPSLGAEVEAGSVGAVVPPPLDPDTDPPMVAGPAAPVPDGLPVDVIPVITDPKHDAAHHPEWD